jgi:hypothetical protein
MRGVMNQQKSRRLPVSKMLHCEFLGGGAYKHASGYTKPAAYVALTVDAGP